MPTQQNSIVESSDWEPYSPERVAELHRQGVPVFIDFTAKWCLTCQANHLVLTSSNVDLLFKDKGIVKMKADWTSHDPVITEALKQYGRNGVPLYVYAPPESDATILPQLLTPDIVINAIEEQTVAIH
jgi:thiol:disulfide interchange protein DsbD